MLELECNSRNPQRLDLALILFDLGRLAPTGAGAEEILPATKDVQLRTLLFTGSKDRRSKILFFTAELLKMPFAVLLMQDLAYKCR